jgi:hypothetical protein
VPFDLIAAGTSFWTLGFAAALGVDVDGLADGLVVEEDELLLPHAAIAPAHISETGTVSQLLDICITAPFPEDGGQHRREIQSLQTV